MPDIQAFRGLRYDLGHVGALAEVIAPPYDVIGPQLEAKLHERHPANVVRLILPREQAGDDDRHNRYTRAARLLKSWRRDGVLAAEPEAAVYVYHQVFEDAGRRLTRRGFMCGVRLARFGEGNIFAHEETHSAVKADRLKLTQACRANLSPIFGLYPDPAGQAQAMLEECVAGRAPLEAADHLGVVHRLWPVTDVEVLAQLEGVIGPKPAFIADGHHRYETACDYRDRLAGRGELPAGHPANWVMMMLVGMNDPGMIVLPTHRLFRGLPPMSSDELASKLGEAFATRLAGEGSDLAHGVWDEIETEGEQGTLGLYTARDDRWLLARVTQAGREMMRELAPDRSEPWRQLGVSILHHLIVDKLLAAGKLPSPLYLRSIDGVVESLDQGDAAGRDATGQISTGGTFELAALVMPATIEHVRQISQHHERMPAKSTYFYPKLLSGLVIRPLE